MYQVVLNINEPFGEINLIKFFNAMIDNQYRPKFEQKIKPSFKNLIEKCWSESGDNRTSFNEIFLCLSSFIINENQKINDEDCCFDDIDIEKVKNYLSSVLKVDLNDLKKSNSY